MIPVTLQPEPNDFEANVRRPGSVFLVGCPRPTGKQWKDHSYWQKASKALYTSYGGICAYTGEWFSRTSASTSVDHFIPKSVDPGRAYDWANYRLTTQKANNNKGDCTDIADPFIVCSGWFVLDLPSCLIQPGDGLPTEVHSLVERTIKVLKLNDDDEYVQGRCNVILDYVHGDISLNYLRQKYPYIAHEIARQDLLEGVANMFRAFPSVTQ